MVLLKRLHVLFFIELPKGCVAGVIQLEHGSSSEPGTCRMRSHSARPVKFRIRGRDTKFTTRFDEVFRAVGTRIIRTPIRALQAPGESEDDRNCPSPGAR